MVASPCTAGAGRAASTSRSRDKTCRSRSTTPPRKRLAGSPAAAGCDRSGNRGCPPRALIEGARLTMCSLLVCWVLFPLAVTALSIGCGLLLEQAAGVRLPAGLLPAAGFAVVLVVAHIATAWDATAELALPAVLVLAVAG